jgi:AraC-like DNA-binding protein
MAEFHFPSHRQPRPLKAEILYWVLNRPEPGSSYARHCHPFWQIEIIRAGEPALETDRRSVTLGEGDMVLIPPYLEHCLRYPDPGIAYCSVKCEVEGLAARPQSIRIVQLAKFPFLRQALDDLLGNVRKVSPDKLTIAANLLNALLTIHYSPGSLQEPGTRLRRAVQDQINQNSGARLSAEEIARRLGYSRNHLSQLFHREAGMTLKSYIDRAVCRNAEKLIVYSAMNISEIGDALGFDSVYSFSRFFKRINGESPTDYKQHSLRSQGNESPKSPGFR